MTLCKKCHKLQQHLPLAVLKPESQFYTIICFAFVLQQHLPLAVLKLLNANNANHLFLLPVATALTACGIETYRRVYRMLWDTIVLQQHLPLAVLKLISWDYYTPHESCNSTYRLRYWNIYILQQEYYAVNVVATALTACGIETDLHELLALWNRLQQHLPLAVLKLSMIFTI